MDCFCSDGGAVLCDRCVDIPVIVRAHQEGRDRLAGREPIPVPAGELEYRSWDVKVVRSGDRVRD